MAQQASHSNAFYVDSENANVGAKNTSAAAGKRQALSNLTSNHVFVRDNEKRMPGQKLGLSFQPTAPGKTNLGYQFPIFHDENMESGRDLVVSSPALPAEFHTLITYNPLKSELTDDKENEAAYWSAPEEDEKEKEDDLKWTCPFRDDIYVYLRDMEHNFRPRPLYMLKQPDITYNMRSVLVDWLVEVGEEYKLQEETIHLAVSYVDRFLSMMSVLKGKLQLVGTACMFIASKHEEIYPPELKDFVYITDDTYSKGQILKMEQLVLNVLKFNLSTPTAYSFLQVYGTMMKASEKVLLLAQYICEISLLEADPFLGFLPSEIGASCLALANYTLEDTVWPEEMILLSGYCLSNLLVVIHCLYEKYRLIKKYPQQAIVEKYKAKQYQCVADIAPPEKLSL